MKYIFLFLFISLLSCKEETPSVKIKSPTTEKNDSQSSDNKQNNKKDDIYNYVNDLKTFASIKNGNPIENFQALANESSTYKIDITKDNFADALKTAASYKHILITVENHTVVMIDDLTNCKPSKSWATCVPYANGYIKKGEMIFKEDYANNIIGIPNGKKRTMYLFK